LLEEEKKKKKIYFRIFFNFLFFLKKNKFIIKWLFLIILLSLETFIFDYLNFEVLDGIFHYFRLRLLGFIEVVNKIIFSKNFVINFEQKRINFEKNLQKFN
jgi:hypothetical protein